MESGKDLEISPLLYGVLQWVIQDISMRGSYLASHYC